jgi:diguanylate cyclase (GGDEF)-like protein
MPSRQPPASQGSILIVDDNPVNLHALSKLLRQVGYTVYQALDGALALASIQAQLPDLILLDLMMPQIDGYEVCRRLSANPQTAAIPIIVLSALQTSVDKVKAFRNGAVDYITKPFHLEEVLARVQHQLAFKTAQQSLHQLNQELENRVQERTHQLEAAHTRLLEMALQDPLTGLPNRLTFAETLAVALEYTRIDSAYRFAVLFLDCDRFKMINDSLGHSTGDQLLLGVAERLRTVQSQHPEVIALARFGGDEFALLLSHLSGPEVAVKVADAILTGLSPSFHLAERELFINASIGIVWGLADYENAEYLLRDADAAMYRAKASGKGQYRWFEPAMHNHALHLLQLESDLRLSLVRDEFQVYYQPIVELHKRTMVGFEALVRWQHPTRGLVTPDHFIPFAEETGLIVDIGQQVLQQACDHLAQWQRLGLIYPDFTISVNLSTQQLLQPDILEMIRRIIECSGVHARHLRLEITESAIIDNRNFVDEVLRTLRSRDIQLSIDDFGTGYSSLSYLHTLPVNCLKIDRAFVHSINTHPDSLGIVPLIINIAHTMNMQVIAEGVETETQYQQLRSLHCDYGQGYLFHQPLSSAAALQLLRQRAPIAGERAPRDLSWAGL